MLELTGTIELLVVETATGEEEGLVLSGKDFRPERRSMLDDVLCEDDDSEHVAYASALGFDFKVVATPRQIDIEDDADEIRIEIVENDLEFVNRKMTKTKWKAETSPRSTEVRAQGRGVGTVRLAISRALATYQGVGFLFRLGAKVAFRAYRLQHTFDVAFKADRVREVTHVPITARSIGFLQLTTWHANLHPVLLTSCSR